jgi:hypothetical protein
MIVKLTKANSTHYRVEFNGVFAGYAEKCTRTQQIGLHKQRVTTYEVDNLRAFTLAGLKTLLERKYA